MRIDVFSRQTSCIWLKHIFKRACEEIPMDEIMSGLCKSCLCILWVLLLTPFFAQAASEPLVYFSEDFLDSNFVSRGWYDGLSGYKVVTDVERGNNVLEINYPTFGGQTGLGALRHSVPDTEVIHVRYYIKYSDNWEWTGQAYGPHEIYLLTNKQSAYAGPAYTNLTCYIEFNNGKPHWSIQDGMNIDTTRIYQDLTQITENRAVAGGNGCGSDGYEVCTAYYSGGKWMNGKG